jgi:hypothetical protein
MTERSDRRRFRRVPIDLIVTVTRRESWEKVFGVAQNISLGGMFVETSFASGVGSGVLLSFTLPNQPGPLLVAGTVRWRSEDGMGVQFGLLGARETHAITQFERERRG